MRASSETSTVAIVGLIERDPPPGQHSVKKNTEISFL
jgi:hypothetical protein